jgi:hypothetical protein
VTWGLVIGIAIYLFLAYGLVQVTRNDDGSHTLGKDIREPAGGWYLGAAMFRLFLLPGAVLILLVTFIVKNVRGRG